MAEYATMETVLIADDDPDLRDILRSVLEPAGFNVIEAENGAAAMQAIRARPPNLVILDYMMPEMTGPQVCEQLRQDVLLRHVPIIMLTGKSETQDKVHGLEAGADDYLVKPFEPRELLARVQMVIRRTARELEANPLTKLPGNISIQRELERRIAGGVLAVCYIDLNRFKAFNDHYGFKRGDEVIKKTAEILLEASRAHGNPQDFVAHIGGDDFIIMTTKDHAEAVCEEVVRRFDEAVPSFYDEEDRARGYLLHMDRKGQEVKVPLVSVAVALVTSEQQPLTHPGQIAKIGAELKAYAKQLDRSTYVKERRLDKPGYEKLP
jgi:PleD family two-component response regulator